MSLISSQYIPHSGPTGAEILVIGESPGTDEVYFKQPFVGKSGELLRTSLNQAGFSCATLDECKNNSAANNNYNIRFANLCNYQPNKNQFRNLIDSPELKKGVIQLEEYISQYPPRLIILLGEQPLEYILGKYNISKLRGSPLFYHNNILTIPTYHPAYILRAGASYPIFSFDLQKAFRYFSKGYQKPTFNLTIDPEGSDLEDCLDEISRASKIAIDIETVKFTNRILSIAFGISRSRAICIPNKDPEGINTNIRRICEAITDEGNKKLIFHNGIFDIEILHNNQIELPIHFDTQIAQHVLQPELEKGLDDITSIYTDIPYYKDKGRAALPENEKGWGKISDEDRLNIYEYNCLDTNATFWCYEEMEKEIEENPNFSHIFKYEMEMHDVAFHIMRAGMFIDETRRKEIKAIVEDRYATEQAFLEGIVGHKINVGSVPKKKELLYEEWKLPERKDEDGKLSTGEDAIVSLISFTKDYALGLKTKDKQYEWFCKVAGLQTMLKIAGLRKLMSSYINIETYQDSRVRSCYKISGTNTGRWSCTKYFNDTGFNAQTMPRESLEV